MSTIAFTRGVPSADLLPVDDLKRAVIEALELDAARCAGLRAQRLPRRCGSGSASATASTPSRVRAVQRLAAGRGHAARAHVSQPTAAQPWSRIPTYDRTLIALRRTAPTSVPVPLEADGVDVDGVRSALDQHPPARMIYVIPTFQNPAGVTLSRDKRTALVALAQEREVLLVEDDPYGLLRFEGDADPDAVRARRRRQRRLLVVVHQDRRAGLRTGYLVLPERLVAPIAKLSTNTYIGPTRLPKRRSRPTAAPAGSSPTWPLPPWVSRPVAMRWSWRCASRSRGDALDDPGGWLLLLDRAARGI